MNDDTFLYRQTHPRFVKQDGEVSSQAFSPTPKDKGRLSVYDGDMISPNDSYLHYTAALGYTSSGVVAVTVAECGAQGLPTYCDPGPFDEHAVVDFRGLTKSATERKARKLKDAANARGWLYRTDT